MSEPFISLYRKYRPKTFKDLIGQDHIASVLLASLKSGKVGHAYLFFGSRGTGKTSVARIFANELKVTDRDIYEIDAASNRGIDDIRELRENVRALPFESPYKVYIVDEVHMLTKEAFNALLKTLEEPPAHVVFILATTELEKVPETVISRCELHTFKKPSEEVLTKYILSIAKKENCEMDKSAGELISRLGDGSFRDALGVLQKVLTLSSDKKLSIEEVEKVTGVPPRTLIFDFFKGIVEGDSAKSLKALFKASEDNFSIHAFSQSFLYLFRKALLIRYAKEMRETLLSESSSEEKEFLTEILKETRGVIRSATLLRFLEAHEQLRYTAIPSLPLELAVVDVVGNDEA